MYNLEGFFYIKCILCHSATERYEGINVIQQNIYEVGHHDTATAVSLTGAIPSHPTRGRLVDMKISFTTNAKKDVK